MALFALIIGAILIVAAVRNSQADLFTALGQDVPSFIVWAAAIIALGAVGFIPGLKPVSRALLALVIIVLIVNNYQKLVSGFTNAWTAPTKTTSNAPAATDASSAGNASTTSPQSWEAVAAQLAAEHTPVAQ